MRRFLPVLMCLMLFAAPVWAQEALDPPLTGQMHKFQVFQKPIKVQEVVLSSRQTGLKYLSDYTGKIILLNIWATWCPPCVQELPSLNALQKDLGGEKFQVVTVSLDQDVDVVKKFLEENKLDQLTAYVDSNGDLKKLEALREVAGIPATLILNQKLDTVALYQGDADWGSSDARAVIDYFIQNVKPTKTKIPAFFQNRSSYY
jgi:thiol-disulfide isomerase/thioredoxin